MSVQTVLKESMKLMLGYSNLYGKRCGLQELKTHLRKYPLEQWLNFLSRIQNTIAEERFSEMEVQQSIVGGVFSKRAQNALDKWCLKHPRQAYSAFVVSERQVSVLQELSILYAPEVLPDKGFNEEGDFDVLTEALLITNDLLHNTSSVNSDDLLAISAHSQVTYNVTTTWRTFPRAVRFYEIGEEARTSDVLTYENLFREATGQSLEDYTMGGICCAYRDEMRSANDIHTGWCPIRPTTQPQNPHEAQAEGAFLAVHAGTPAIIRSEIEKFEVGLYPRDFNLIALSRFPIIHFDDGRFFILNHGSLARSLFDGSRHAIMTAAIKRGGGAPREVGGVFGRLFQSFVLKVLRELFGEQVVLIPESSYPGNCDCLIFFEGVVVAVEIKGEHFNALTHFKLMNKLERVDELRKAGLDKSVKQISNTITALKAGQVFKIAKIPPIDWASTSVVPVVITDEQFPIFPLLWEGLYSEIERPLAELDGTIADVCRLRLLSIDEIDLCREVKSDQNFGALLYKWGRDPSTYDFRIKNFLLSYGHTLTRNTRIADLESAFRKLASRLGFDPNEIKS